MNSVKVNNRSVGKLQSGIVLGYDKDDQLRVFPVGNVEFDKGLEMIMTFLYDFMHVPLVNGVPKEQVYDAVVEYFSLTVDKYLPEKADISIELAEHLMKAEREWFANNSQGKTKMS